MYFTFGAQSIANLSSFKDLPRHEQGVMLLKRLACLVPRGQTFDPHSTVDWRNGRPERYGLATGFPRNELKKADSYLLTYPWSEIVLAGYVAEAHPGSRWYRITDEGWAVVMSYISPLWGGTRAE